MTGSLASLALLYPFTLGMLAAVNPCGFPLLPTYLAFFTGSASQLGAVERTARALLAGALVTLGFLVLFGALGGAVEAGWLALASRATTVARYVMVAVGVALIGVGLAWLAGRPLRLSLPRSRRAGAPRRGPLALLGFGLTYGVASLGCALPLFVSGVAAGFSAHSTLGGIAVLAAYGLGMGSVLSVLAVGVALLGSAAAGPLRRVSRMVPVLGGALVSLVGLYLTAYWLSAIIAPAHVAPGQRIVDDVQQALARWVSAHPSVIGACLGGVVVLALAIVGLRRATSPAGPADQQGSATPALSRTPSGTGAAR